MNSRRSFLQSAFAGSALISLSGWAPNVLRAAANHATGGEHVLVVLQLSGGNDGLNTVIPYGDDAYYQNRFTLAMRPDEVLKLDDYHGLHPALAGFEHLWQNQKLAIVQGVGYPEPNRSHFESMDLWHTAHQTTPSIRTGWLGRWAASLSSDVQLPTIHLGAEKQPLALASTHRPALSLRSLETLQQDSGLSAAAWQTIATQPRSRVQGTPDLLGYLQENAGLAWETSRRLEQISQESTGKRDYPSTDLARKLSMVSTLIEANFPTQIYYVAIDGFDTHSNQRDAHAALLREVGDAIKAFVTELDQQGHGDRVSLFVFSEFGRRVRENASRGTDHGAAAPVFVIGNGVKAGLSNAHPSLSNLVEGDLQHQIDYRQVYTTILKRWLNADPEAILGEPFREVELFQKS